MDPKITASAALAAVALAGVIIYFNGKSPTNTFSDAGTPVFVAAGQQMLCSAYVVDATGTRPVTVHLRGEIAAANADEALLIEFRSQIALACTLPPSLCDKSCGGDGDKMLVDDKACDAKCTTDLCGKLSQDTKPESLPDVKVFQCSKPFESSRDDGGAVDIIEENDGGLPADPDGFVCASQLDAGPCTCWLPGRRLDAGMQLPPAMVVSAAWCTGRGCVATAGAESNAIATGAGRGVSYSVPRECFLPAKCVGYKCGADRVPMMMQEKVDAEKVDTGK